MPLSIANQNTKYLNQTICLFFNLMTHQLSQFTPIADAIVKLFYPHAEVVLHDIIDDPIAYIGNLFSGRAVGDVSHLGLDP